MRTVLSTFLRDIAADVECNLIDPGEEWLIVFKAAEVLVHPEKYFLRCIPSVGFVSQHPPRHPHYPLFRMLHDLFKSHHVAGGSSLDETSQRIRKLGRNVYGQPFF